MTKLLTSDDLCHWGILGMKWGQRRYQYEDGTLTPEGILRYRKAKEAYDRSWNEKREAARNGKKLSPIKKAKDRISNVNLTRSLSGKKEESTEWMTSQRYGSKSAPSEERFEEMVQKYADRQMSKLQKLIGDNPYDIPTGLEDYLTPEMIMEARKGAEETARKKLKELFPEYDKTPLVVSDGKNSYYREDDGDGEDVWYSRKIKSDDPEIKNRTVSIDTGGKSITKDAFNAAKEAEKLLGDKSFHKKLADFVIKSEEGFNGYNKEDIEWTKNSLDHLYGAHVTPDGDIQFYFGWWDVEYDPKRKKMVTYAYAD